MEAKTDMQLLAGINDRNIKAFDALFHKYYRLLCAYAYSIVKEEEEAKDIVQGLFIALWEKRRLEELEGNVKNYLYRAVHNRCLNYLRNHESKVRRHTTYEESGIQSEEEEDGQSIEMIYSALEANLKALPKQRREAISLVYLQDKKYQEVADTMGISMNSLKTHLKIGLKNLRKKLRKV